jgi:putative heme-binding domain-containing protein
MRNALLVVLQLVLVALVSPVHAQRDLRDIPDPDAELERQSFVLPEGMEINLFASEPMISNPIGMNWDSRGRLWVACSPIYPHIEPGKRHDDKIIVLEDRDGDGRADHHTVFADDLLIPTSVLALPGDGHSAYVANSTEILLLRDEDGDGKADSSRAVLSGFGTEDTHHIIHGFHFGHDGMFYFNQSVYIHSHVETPWGVRRLAGAGAWQFRPETFELEVFSRGLVNPWGHVFDRWGQSFMTDGAYLEGLNHAFPGATFFRAEGAKRILKGMTPGQPKHCGLEILGGRHLPDDWSGSYITADFRGHRVNRFVLTDNGSSYAARQVEDLISTSHVAFRPIDLKMGPDGAIYIADLYNPIIQHGEVSFRDPRRDHQHGRIWRITAKGRPTITPPRIVEASIEELLEALTLPEHWHRLHARMELKSRGTDAVLAKLDEWTAALDDSDTQFEHLRVEALWTYQALNVPAPRLLEQLLESDEFRARAAAVRVVGKWHDRLDNTLELLESTITDPHPRVRLEAVIALRRVGTLRAFEIAMQAMDKDVDASIDYSLWFTARELIPGWFPAFKRGDLNLGGDQRKLVFALQSMDSAEVVAPLVQLLDEGKIPGDARVPVLVLLANLGDTNVLRKVFDVLASGDSLLAADRVKVLSSLRRASADRNIRPAGSLEGIANLLATDDQAVGSEVAQLMGFWKVPTALKKLTGILESQEASRELRSGAALGLAGLGTPEAKDTLTRAASAAVNPVHRAVAVEALARVDAHMAVQHAAAFLEQFDSETATEVASSVFDAVIRPREGAGLLATALEGRKISSQVAIAGIESAECTGRDLGVLVSALKKAGDLPPTEIDLDAKSLATLINEVKSNGKISRGEAIYKRTELACTSCHAIAGVGGKVGPDLISLGASAQVDYIIESLLDPNRKIKEGFHLTEVLTKSFDFFSGTLIREDEHNVVLRTADGQDTSIPKSQIQESHVRNRSLMPSGVVSQLPRREFVDLVRFLSSLGRDR